MFSQIEKIIAVEATDKLFIINEYSPDSNFIEEISYINSKLSRLKVEFNKLHSDVTSSSVVAILSDIPDEMVATIFNLGNLDCVVIPNNSKLYKNNSWLNRNFEVISLVESLILYKRRSNCYPTKNNKNIQGLINKDDDTCYLQNYSYDFQFLFVNFLSYIRNLRKKNKKTSFVRVGDGDINFLMGLPFGSAEPGRRALSLKYHLKTNLNDCRIALLKNTYLSFIGNSKTEKFFLLYMLLMRYFIRYFPNYHMTMIYRINLLKRVINRLINTYLKFYNGKTEDALIKNYKIISNSRALETNVINKFKYPIEIIYASLASRALFKIFTRIMIVGAEEKVGLIKQLMLHSKYREYLGINEFVCFIGVPQIGAADNEKYLIQKIICEIEKSKPDLVLYGIGSSKNLIISNVSKKSSGIHIDVGVGVDALAGIVDNTRPYFGNWINFKLKKHDYSTVDLLSNNSNNIKNIQLL